MCYICAINLVASTNSLRYACELIIDLCEIKRKKCDKEQNV